MKKLHYDVGRCHHDGFVFKIILSMDAERI
jgi:hypothetical protein